MYMLDTNICIYVLKNRTDKLRNKFKAIRDIYISSITYIAAIKKKARKAADAKDT